MKFQQLNAESIDSSIEQIIAFFQESGVGTDTVIRSRIALEETMLFYLHGAGDSPGAEDSPDGGKTAAAKPLSVGSGKTAAGTSASADNPAMFHLDLRKRFGQVTVEMQFPGPARNPFDPKANAQGEVLHAVMGRFADGPLWRYDVSRGCNVVTLAPFCQNSFANNAKITWRYLRPYRGSVALAVLLQALDLVVQIALPLINARLITSYTDSLLMQVVVMACTLLALEVLSALCFRGYNVIYQRTYSKVAKQVERQLAESVLETKLASLEDHGTGLFIQRMTVDTMQLITGFGNAAMQIGYLLRSMGLLIAMLVVDPLAFAIAVVCFACNAALEFHRTSLVNAKDTVYRQTSEAFSSRVSEMVRGVRDIRLLSNEKSFLSMIGNGVDQTCDAQLSMLQTNVNWNMLRQQVDNVFHLIFLLYLAAGIYVGHLTPVVALVLFNYRLNIRENPIFVGVALECIKQFNLSAGRIYALMYDPEFHKERFGEEHLEKVQGRIAFHHVAFSYGADSVLHRRQKVLEDVDFSVEPGQTVAFVGRSGSGKSTILNLLEGLYRPDRGTITIDGVDIAQLDAASIRGNIAMVSQQPYIFNMTIRQNLALVKEDLSEEQMREVCRIACIDEDICAMPDGYDTLVGEGGMTISGGQRQRLAIARALLREAPVLLLDEATSALDNVLQAQINKALKEQMSNRTVFIVAHRLSTIVDADCIFYLQDGRILAKGTHAELMETCPEYSALFNGTNS